MGVRSIRRKCTCTITHTKLEVWLGKIQARAAFGRHKAEEASATLDGFRKALLTVANNIYVRAGLDPKRGGERT